MELWRSLTCQVAGEGHKAALLREEPPVAQGGLQHNTTQRSRNTHQQLEQLSMLARAGCSCSAIVFEDNSWLHNTL
jgi:hypothetical protein